MAENSIESSATTRRFCLPKSARLHLRTLVNALYADGKALYDFPLRMTYRCYDTDTLASMFRDGSPKRTGRVQMMVTIPKRKRRHAVDRVLMRRRVREAYRLNKHILDPVLDQIPNLGTLSVAFVYLKDENVEYAEIEAKMKNLLTLLARKLNKKVTNEVKQ